MNKTQTDLLNNMKKTVLEFIQDLKDNIFVLDSDKADLMVVEFYFNRMHKLDVMEHIVNYVLPHKEKIEKEDISFFLINKKEIFKDLPDERVNYFANLIQTGDIGEENLAILWTYFGTMVVIASEYRKIK